MGKQTKKEQIIKINTKKGVRNKLECMEELQLFFACMAKNKFDIDDHCAREQKALAACATAAARKPKVTNTVNYHLQRISRLMK